MSYHDRLTAEINEVLDALAEQGKPWQATWIAHEICGRHAGGLAEADDADFWRHCGYRDCRREVTRCINRRAGDKPEDPQHSIKLPGYQHLQAYYVVERDGEEIGVPVRDCTDDELNAKKAQYRAMGAACFAHADEIDRFQRLRTQAA